MWSWNAHMYIHTHTSERTILTRICLATKAPDVSIRLIELLFHCLDCFIDAFTLWFSQAPHSLTHSVIPSVTFLFIHAFSVLFWKLAFSALKLVDVFLMFRGIFHTSTNAVPGCWMIPTCCKHLQTRYRQWCFKPRKAWVGTRQILLDTFRFCLFPRSGHEHNGDYHGLTFQCRIKWFLCTRAGMFASSWSTYAFHDFFLTSAQFSCCRGKLDEMKLCTLMLHFKMFLFEDAGERSNVIFTHITLTTVAWHFWDLSGSELNFGCDLLWEEWICVETCWNNIGYGYMMCLWFKNPSTLNITSLSDSEIWNPLLAQGCWQFSEVCEWTLSHFER